MIGENFRTLGSPLGQDANDRIDKYLASQFPFFSRSEWQNRLKAHLVYVNDQPVKTTYRPRNGDQIKYYYPDLAEPEVNTNLTSLWQDEAILALAKPAPLPIHEGGPYKKNTLIQILKDKFPKGWAPLHRLDRETSGILLCAADQKSRNALTADFSKQRIEKKYLAIVIGNPTENKWTVDQPIGAPTFSTQIRIKKWVNEEGLSALTYFRVVARKPGYSLILASPKTGRTNQIRIHLAWSGFPILGDKLYHRDEQVFLDFYEYGNTKSVQERAGFFRHCLHACQMKLIHPGTGKKIRIFCPLPQDIRSFWNLL